MKTVEEMKAEQAKALAKLEAEHSIAALCPVPPKSVMMTSTGEKSWITYNVDSLWAALDLMAKFQPLAFAKFKGTYTRYEPAAINDRRTRDKGEEMSGPYLALLDVDQGEGFGPSVVFAFFVVLGDNVHKVRLSLEKDFRSYSGMYGAQFVANERGESRQLHGSRYINGFFQANSRVSSMAETYTKWGSGSRESCRFTYAFGADFVNDDGSAGYDIDAIYRLENLAALMHGERPEATSN